jgi:hypothetical protein
MNGNVSLFEHYFKALTVYLEARIRIRIRIIVKGGIRIRMKQGLDPHKSDKQDPDPHQSGKQDPDLVQCQVGSGSGYASKRKVESASALKSQQEPDSDPNQSNKQDPDPHQSHRTIRIRIKATSRIRIRINVTAGSATLI